MIPTPPGNRTNIFILVALTLVYIFLLILSMDYCYFWDNIQQISKEAHWFYLNNFSSLLLPAHDSGSEMTATGYHPPLMGIITAALWKVFGYGLWVSHAFTLAWASLLIFNVWKLSKRYFEERYAGWVTLILMLEPTLLAQFVTASPDFIIFTTFIMSFRAILEYKRGQLAVAIFFLCCINMRGIFIGAMLFVVDCYVTYLRIDVKNNLLNGLKTIILPYLPTFIVLLAYFVYYFSARGWFFANSSYSEHYAMPDNAVSIMKHFAALIIRNVENGRFFIWGLAFYTAFKAFRNKYTLTLEIRAMLLFFLLFTGLYLIFVFITQMPFSTRYFMPQFFALTILALWIAAKWMRKSIVMVTFMFLLIFQVTGHLWIYPDKIAKSWDCTLAHLPYYSLREDCFDYIDQHQLNYDEIAAGFSLYGNRQFIELKNTSAKVSSDPTGRKYFLNSNISNLEDNFATKLKDRSKWKPIKRFEKGLVYIEILENISESAAP